MARGRRRAAYPGREVRLTRCGLHRRGVFLIVVTDEDGAAVSARRFPGVRPAELRCDPDSSVLRGDAAAFRVVAADGTVVASSEL